MADEKQLEILKKGVGDWNLWRSENIGVDVDLRRAHLRMARLRGANLHEANLLRADLSEANLSAADLSASTLFMSNLTGADLAEADLSRSVAGWTAFTDVDLSRTKGLETVEHMGPSTIGIDTIYNSKGQIPELFLRGAGVPDTFITYIRSLVGQPIEFHSCFISYSSRDDEFAQRLHTDLQSKGVRCWYAPEDLKIGDRFRDRIEESIRIHDKLLVVLSANSIDSRWVQTEVEAGLERERRESRPVLFPISIDNVFERTNQAWAADIRRTRYIGDFTHWKDHQSYEKALDRLLRDLAAENPPKA